MYKRLIETKVENLDAIKALIAQYNEEFKQYEAKLDLPYFDKSNKEGYVYCLTPQVRVVTCDYSYKRYGNSSYIEIDSEGKIGMHVNFPNWAESNEEIDDVINGLRRFNSCYELYVDFLNEFMEFGRF